MRALRSAPEAEAGLTVPAGPLDSTSRSLASSEPGPYGVPRGMVTRCPGAWFAHKFKSPGRKRALPSVGTCGPAFHPEIPVRSS